MTITEAESYIKMLLKQHLPKDYKNWKIEFYYTSKYAGCCDFNRKAITLSLFSMGRSSTRQTQEACQHEVAHAIAFVKFNCTNHNYIWEAVCKNIVKCPANLNVSPDYDFEVARIKDFIASIKIEIIAYLKEDSKFFFGNNMKFLTVAYEKYRFEFIETKINSINIFEKVLYYHLLKQTNSSNVFELNETLKQPFKIHLSEVHNTGALITIFKEINSEYKQEVLQVNKHFFKVNLKSICQFKKA
ncbi:MAG: SprT-like domain-containing protein [Bacteroidales bacterium]